MTPHLFAFFEGSYTILHFLPAGGMGWSSLWDDLNFKYPSTPCKSVY